MVVMIPSHHRLSLVPNQARPAGLEHVCKCYSGLALSRHNHEGQRAAHLEPWWPQKQKAHPLAVEVSRRGNLQVLCVSTAVSTYPHRWVADPSMSLCAE
jgi:hypothetical protein